MVEILVLMVFAAALRILPRLLAPQGTGVDQWFWRAYIEKLRSAREFPPRLPQFLLDEAQWYPPLFPVLLARLPAAVFERHAQELAVLIDLLRMMLVMGTVFCFTSSLPAVWIAGGVYATTPLLVTYNLQLNPRGLGALFLDAVWLFVAIVIFKGGSAWLLGGAAACGALVLLTHKMTTQLFCFVAICAAVLARDVRLLLLLPAAVVLAMLFSKGFYWKVLRAHCDILRFWYRNWPWVGANPVLESPIYGETGYKTPTRYYQPGLKGMVRRLKFIAGFNPWVLVALLLGTVSLAQMQPGTPLLWAFGWLLLTLCFSLATTEIPSLRCMGNGYLYGYNGTFPAALVLGCLHPLVAERMIEGASLFAGGFACVAALWVFFRTLHRSRTLKIDEHLDAVIRRLAELPRGVVMCLPAQWHDVVAYRSGQAVAFGGHGFGFRNLQPVFPRLTVPVKSLINRYQITYLLTCEGYLNARFVADLPESRVESFENYRLHIFIAEPGGAER